MVTLFEADLQGRQTWSCATGETCGNAKDISVVESSRMR